MSVDKTCHHIELSLLNICGPDLCLHSASYLPQGTCNILQALQSAAVTQQTTACPTATLLDLLHGWMLCHDADLFFKATVATK